VAGDRGRSSPAREPPGRRAGAREDGDRDLWDLRAVRTTHLARATRSAAVGRARHRLQAANGDPVTAAMVPRVLVVVCDSWGVGDAPDATSYGDEGSDTLANV